MTALHVNGIEIYHEVHGRPVGEGDWVLNIGGTGGDLRQTFPARSPLNEHFRVIHYDQRGLGRTSTPDVDYSMADYADDAAALIEQVAGGPCHVIGTSFGGMVALNLAVRRPDLVDRLVLLVTSPGGDHSSYPLPELQELDPADAFPIRMRLLDERWDPDAVEPIPGLGAIYDFIVKQQLAVAPPHARSGLDRQLAARDGHDVMDDLDTIDQPALVGAGRYDGLAPVENSDVMAERMPNARLEIFDGGHLVMFQDPLVWPTVIDFLHETGRAE